MNESDLLALATRQRAHREFTDEPVPDGVVTALLGVAVRAPSAENVQPWVFVVVRDQATRAEIGELTRRAWEGGGRAHSESRLPPAMLAAVEHSATGGLARAPVHVVVGGDTEVCARGALEASVWPAVQNLLLAATAAGLGSALTTLTTGFAAELRALVGFPDTVRPLAVVPLGWPARPLGVNRRRPVSEVAHAERFGVPWTDARGATGGP